MRHLFSPSTWPVSRRRAVMAIAAVVMLLALLLGSLPAWQRSQRNARQISARSQQLATLGDWAVAGFWMEAGARRWQQDQGPLYARRFPELRSREQLYLELARVARDSGIDPLSVGDGKQAPQVSAMTTPDETMAGAPGDGAPADGTTQDGAMLDGFEPDLARLPSSDLVSFPLEVRFEADYQRLARFMDGLATIDRALTVQNLTAAPEQGAVHVVLEMQYYAQKTD